MGRAKPAAAAAHPSMDKASLEYLMRSRAHMEGSDWLWVRDMLEVVEDGKALTVKQGITLKRLVSSVIRQKEVGRG